MSTTEAPKKENAKGLYAKLAEVMAEVGRVPKNGYNDFHKYKYVREDDLVESVRDALSERGVLLIPSATSVSKDGNLSTVFLTFTFADGETGQTHVAEWVGTGDDKGDKGLYKAYTGALKYFLMKSFLIPTGDDPEGDSKTDKRGAESKAKPANGNGKPPALSAEMAKALLEVAKEAQVNGQKLSVYLTSQGVEHPEVTSEQTAVAALRKLTPIQAEDMNTWLAAQAKATA